MYHQQVSLTARPSSAAGTSGSGSGSAGRKARDQGSSHPSSSTAQQHADIVDIEMDGAEGEVDEAGEDNALYCFCQEKSYGEMIGCDNEDCRFEWVSAFG